MNDQPRRCCTLRTEEGQQKTSSSFYQIHQCSPPPSHPGSKLAETLKTFITGIPASQPVHGDKLLEVRAFKKWLLLVFSRRRHAAFQTMVLRRKTSDNEKLSARYNISGEQILAVLSLNCAGLASQLDKNVLYTNVLLCTMFMRSRTRSVLQTAPPLCLFTSWQK